MTQQKTTTEGGNGELLKDSPLACNDLLIRIGASIAGIGPGFVCRVGGKPAEWQSLLDAIDDGQAAARIAEHLRINSVVSKLQKHVGAPLRAQWKCLDEVEEELIRIAEALTAVADNTGERLDSEHRPPA